MNTKIIDMSATTGSKGHVLWIYSYAILASFSMLMGVSSLYGQSHYSGVVVDTAGHPIPQAMLQVLPSGVIGLTDGSGVFLLTAQEADTAMVIRSLGYVDKVVRFQSLDGEVPWQFTLWSSSYELSTVEVVEQKMDVLRRLNANALLDRVDKQPTVAGIADPFQAVMKLPGVQPALEGLAQYQVRGFESTYNQYLLHGIPTFESAHLFNLISVFNPEVTDDMRFYKYGVPIGLNGNLASYFDGSYKDRAVDSTMVTLELGALHSGLTVKGQNAREDIDYTVGLRFAYPSIISLFQSVESVRQGFREEYFGLTFGDLQWNVLYRPDKGNHQWRFFGLAALDNIRNARNDDFLSNFFSDARYQKLSGVVGLAHEWVKDNKKWSTVLGTSVQHIDLYNEEEFKNDDFWTGRSIIDYTREDSRASNQIAYLRSVLSLATSQGNLWQFGLSWRMDALEPGRSSFLRRDTLGTYSFESPSLTYTGHTLTLYSQYEHYWSRNIKTTMGLSLNRFSHGDYQVYYPQLRGLVEVPVRGAWQAYASIDMLTQTNHSLNRSPNILDLGNWIAADADRPISQYTQLNMGFFNKTGRWRWQTNAFVGRAHDLVTPVVELEIGNYQSSFPLYTEGAIRNFGIENQLEYQPHSDLFAHISYSFLDAEEQYPAFNSGDFYSIGTARRHTLRLASEFRVSKKWKCYAQWEWGSPQHLDLPASFIQDDQGTSVPYVRERYVYQLPAFHRLDVGMTKTVHAFGKKNNAELSISVLNLYNRLNVSAVRLVEENINGVNTIQVQGLSVLPI